MDGEEQLFDPKHPVWKIILVLGVGLLLLGGVDIRDIASSLLGAA
jgi:Sec-independent protein translocase protein TatA